MNRSDVSYRIQCFTFTVVTPTIAAVVPSGHRVVGACKVIGGDTERPLQVGLPIEQVLGKYPLSCRSSLETHPNDLKFG